MKLTAARKEIGAGWKMVKWLTKNIYAQPKQQCEDWLGVGGEGGTRGGQGVGEKWTVTV